MDARLLLTVLVFFLPASETKKCLLSKYILNFQHNSLYPDFAHDFTMRSLPPVQSIHLALSGDAIMRVNWLNPVPFSHGTFTPQCFYGNSSKSMINKVFGLASTYPSGDFEMTLNTALLDLHKLRDVYETVYYVCGDTNYGWSETTSFTLQPAKLKQNGGDAALIALVGDMGVTHGEHTMASMAKRVESNEVQMLVHVGDISYANKYGGESGNNSYIWANYMNQLQPVVSKVPYMLCPGNHEGQFHFAGYLNWYTMPTSQSGSSSPFWYSFDYMGIHFLSYSTEHDFTQNSTQYAWIKQDLIKANKNRANIPWIMVFGHRPLYCSSFICSDRCDVDAPRFRSYLEDLLYDQKVDVVMSGHDHNYERTYPVYKAEATQKDYDNPKAPMYIVNGAAGNPEWNDPSFKLEVPWRAHAEFTFATGYLLLQPSTTQLHFQYVRSISNTIVDQFTITKTPKK